MQIIATATLCIITLINAQPVPTKYFVGLYESPMGEKHMPYPIDLCVNTETSIMGGAEYGKYTCNPQGDVVTYTHYEGDSTCTKEPKIRGTSTMDGKNPGDLYSFQCFGVDSYVEARSTINDADCNNKGGATTTVVTNICYRLRDGDSAMVRCGENDAVQSIYEDDECLVENKGDSDGYKISMTQCIVFETFLFWKINTLMKSCKFGNVGDGGNVGVGVVGVVGGDGGDIGVDVDGGDGGNVVVGVDGGDGVDGRDGGDRRRRRQRRTRESSANSGIMNVNEDINNDDYKINYNAWNFCIILTLIIFNGLVFILYFKFNNHHQTNTKQKMDNYI